MKIETISISLDSIFAVWYWPLGYFKRHCYKRYLLQKYTNSQVRENLIASKVKVDKNTAQFNFKICNSGHIKDRAYTYFFLPCFDRSIVHASNMYYSYCRFLMIMRYEYCQVSLLLTLSARGAEWTTAKKRRILKQFPGTIVLCKLCIAKFKANSWNTFHLYFI